jgi:hypothetical protein
MTRSPFHHDKPETSNVQLERSSCIVDPQGSRSPFEDSMMCVRLSRCCPAVTLACRPALHNNTCILSICMGLSEFLCVGCVLAVCWLCVGSVLAVCWVCACCAFRYNAMVAPLQKLNLSAVLWHQVRCVCS